MVWLGSVPSRIAVFLAIASIVVFAGGVLVEGKLVLQTDPIQWVNQKSQVIKDLHVLDKETGSSSELGVYVQSKQGFSNKTVGFLDGFTRGQLKKYPGTLLTGSSIVEVVSDLSDVPGAAHLAPTGRTGESRVPGRAEGRPALDRDTEQRRAQPRLPHRAERARRAGQGRQGDPEDDHPARGSAGDAIRVSQSSASVCSTTSNANRVLLTYLAILFVFLFLTVRLRSIVRALLSLVPVLIAVGAASLFAYVLSLKLSPMTAVGGPLVVAACTEFTSLILLRFVEERRRGLLPRAAVDVTARRTGRAFIVSALTAISGVAVIATSSLPLLRDFGIIVALNVTVALLSALIVLPPLLIWADEKHHWVSRGLVPKEILEKADNERGPAPTLGTIPGPVAGPVS